MRITKRNGSLFPFVLLLLIMLFLSTGCSGKSLEYRMEVSGQIEAAGELCFLDYCITVYEDEASNSCGSCEYQPVCLYVGATAIEVAQAVEDVVNRADDLWEIVSIEGDALSANVVLREKTAGSVQEIAATNTLQGLSIATQTSGRSVTMLAKEADSVEVASTAVAFPENPQRLAAVYGPSYELLVMLGAEEKIVVRADVQTADFPWAEKVFSRITSIPQLNQVHNAVNFEELMTYQPDVVYTFPRQQELTQLANAKVAALAGQTGETLDVLLEQVDTYAQTLGADAIERAAEYRTYFEERVAWVRERTDTLSEEERTSVYYAGVDVLTTYGTYSDLTEVVSIAGGRLVSEALEAGNRTQIDYEQLMAWNPEVIFIDHGGMNDGKTVDEIRAEILGDSVYASLQAVKDNEIYLTPSGVFYWDMGIQKILLIQHMAKILHPELFEDLDMEQEVMSFYQQFFGYELTREEAGQILNRENPTP
jgi:iron complex transport system substrate-binding protein